MTHCSRCLYSENHPLNITFDDNYLCSGCRVHEEKDQLDWAERLIKLKKIVGPYKNSKRSIYNCIIPVSGAKDSYFIVYFVKKILGLNPLLVTYNKLYNTEIGIRNLSYLKTIFGCPLLTMTPSPDIIRKINLETVYKIGSIYWHCIAGQTVFPVQTAYKFKIPLIIWGAHQGIDQVGMFSHTDEVEMTRKYRKEHDLMGYEAEDLLVNGSLLESDLENYFYPHDKEIESAGVRGIYLNNYIRWDSKAQHELMINKFHYETMFQQRTFDAYNDIDCHHYSGLHDYIKYIKWGFGKVTDHVCREIRLKRLSRNQGIRLVEKYQNKIPNDTSLFCNFNKIKESSLLRSIEKHRNKKIWKKIQGKWEKKAIRNDDENKKFVLNNKLNLIEKCNFNAKSKKDKKKLSNEYITLGRGWVEK